METRSLTVSGSSSNCTQHALFDWQPVAVRNNLRHGSVGIEPAAPHQPAFYHGYESMTVLKGQGSRGPEMQVVMIIPVLGPIEYVGYSLHKILVKLANALTNLKKGILTIDEFDSAGPMPFFFGRTRCSIIDHLLLYLSNSEC